MLKEKILNKKVTIGSWITIGHNDIAEILAKAGFDWLAVDLEHSTIPIDKAGDLIRIIDLSGCSPLVRLTSNDENQIKRVMDAGAHGIIVPMVNTVEDAKKAIKSTRYAPTGTRGVGLARAQGYGNNFNDYFKWQLDPASGPLVIVQIEHIEAVKNLKEIISLPEVDAFMIGPYDLSCSMGIPGDFANSKFTEILNEINIIAKEVGTPSGIHIVEPNVEQLNDAIIEGYTFIAYGVDMRMLDTSARNGLESINREKI
ncbi:aldolase/citrate lyase family protein [Gammaproteobacteria bacterium]|nr:aldolase/citrate lyase family protein [Gammaproteobacteria bacterium]